ncbi:Fpg/Nei family DNA glycosylase [Thioalkalivibrio sp. ALE19]|uniref:Fpg/Nei family DNA glycosylase n=1 Tax=Thioalkalivibrio sp. ALE19 TaxID=1266909 RepID=UPI000407CD4F|nr:DNA-formamidopyrimidine glycosylase family protein [Thioalkalivibrio sp. ALE19]
MPEGDTIHRLAAMLRPRLEGAALEAVATRAARGEPLREHGPMRADALRARGKHLLMELIAADATPWLLRTHLGMWGTWHEYARGAEWSKPAPQAHAVLTLEDRMLVCFHPRELAWRRMPAVGSEAADVERLNARVGPDLLATDVDIDAVVARVRRDATADRPLADVLLDQSLAAGIGNVYKSELLFLHGCHPRTPVGRVSDPVLRALHADAVRLLRRNLRPGPRITRERAEPDAFLYVYGREGEACRRCAAVVRRALLGQHGRATWWCPVCQPEGVAGSSRNPGGVRSDQ